MKATRLVLLALLALGVGSGAVSAAKFETNPGDVGMPGALWTFFLALDSLFEQFHVQIVDLASSPVAFLYSFIDFLLQSIAFFL